MPRKRTIEEGPTDTPTAVAEEPAQEGGPEKPSFAERVGQKERPTVPDPFKIATDLVAGVHLFESKRDRQMAIRFDQKPPQSVIEKMHEAQWTWKPEDQIWTDPVRPESAMRTRINAERLYQEVRQMVRAEKGIETSQEIPF